MDNNVSQQSKPKSVKKFFFTLCLVFVAGLFYAIFVLLTGWSIPCYFYQCTGLYCPGCGVTNMCLNLLKGNIINAFHANPFLMLCSPFFIVLAVRSSIRYCKTEKMTLCKWESVMVWCLIGASFLFFLARNFG